MTLQYLFNRINEIALNLPEINEIIKTGNIYTLNEKRNAKYAVFCCVQDVHSSDFELGTTTYQFSLYYIDRLTSDKGNKIQVQSTAIECLKGILRRLEMEEDVEYSNVEFNVFSDSFDGLCCGAYANVGIIVSDEVCYD